MFCILVQKSEEIEESRALDNSDECNGECQYGATFKINFALVSSSELRRLVKAEFENVNTQILNYMYIVAAVFCQFCGFAFFLENQKLRKSTRVNLKLHCS